MNKMYIYRERIESEVLTKWYERIIFSLDDVEQYCAVFF